MGTTTVRDASKRIPSLDGIRTLSVAWVLIDHLSLALGRGDNLDFAGLGVRTFFVLSGFLITGLLIKELERDGEISLTRFYFRRTMRIFPPLYLYVGAMVLLGMVGLTTVSPRSAVPPLLYVSNLVPVVRTFGHTWSLSTEEQFYLIWPAILVFLGTRKSELVLAAAVLGMPLLWIVSTLAGGRPHLLSQLGHLNMGHLPMGCLLAFMTPRLRNSGAYMRVIRSPWILTAPLLLFALNIPNRIAGDHNGLVFLALNILLALSIDAAIVNEKTLVGRFLNWKPMVLIGAMSYSLYLWQQAFTGLGRSYATFRGVPILSNLPVALLATFACASLSYFFVERFSLKLRSALEPRLFRTYRRMYRTATTEEAMTG